MRSNTPRAARAGVRLESVGLHPGGAANEADKTVLGELSIDTGLLNASTYSYFDAAGRRPEGSRVGTCLGVGVWAPDELASRTAA